MSLQSGTVTDIKQEWFGVKFKCQKDVFLKGTLGSSVTEEYFMSGCLVCWLLMHNMKKNNEKAIHVQIPSKLT